MIKRVLFLGAGASAHFNYPTTAQILGLILHGIDSQTLFGRDERRRMELLAYLEQLMPGLAPWRVRKENGLPWITELLSLIDQLIAQENGISQELSHDKLQRCRSLLEQALSEVLRAGAPPSLEHVPEPVRTDLAKAREAFPQLFDRQAVAPADLGRLLDWVDQDCAIITTNYDTLLETELYAKVGDYADVWRRVDFGFAAREPATGTLHPRPVDARFSIFKLHGSLNWLRCARCDRVYINTFGAISHLAFRDGHVTADNQCHCGYGPLAHVLVTPSFVRSMHDINLRQIWQGALDALRTAQEWAIVGYSLPQEDVAIRSLLLRGYLARAPGEPKPKIAVHLIDRKSEASYKVHFPDSTYSTEGLRGFLDSSSSAP
jgi:hypothetical protein